MPILANPRLRLPVLILVAIGARALTFGNPVVHVDEEFYFVTALRMWQGALPFVDIWDRKPVGLFLLYAIPARLGFPAGILAYQLLATASAIATAWAVARLADRLGYAAGATAAGIAYLLWLVLLGGQDGQAPVFYNLLMIVAALLIVPPHITRARGFGAMVLVGIALQIKYSVVFEGIFFGLWLMLADWRATRRPVVTLAYGAALAAVALAPTGIAAAWYAAIGRWDAFAYANFISIFHRNPDPLGELAQNLGQLILIVSPVVSLAVLALRRETPSAGAAERRFVALWLAVAIGSVLVFRPWFDHYALPILLPACAAAAGLLGRATWQRRWTSALLLTAALAGQITLLVQRMERGDARQLAAIARAVGHGPGCLYVYSGNPMIYAATGRCALSPYLVSSHLSRMREAGATGVDQDGEIRRILAARPAVIVMRPPFKGERPIGRALVVAAVARDYRLTATLPMGNELLRVYHRTR
ncbi:hypothetical protein [Sphingomonas sp. CLY1604]|uniref:hypothetical protein n=1 Tax=Sphingomonas sp. CLY1604 TaxID=3457786 RepID=UPI003FD74CC8